MTTIVMTSQRMGMVTMTYSKSLPAVEKNFGVDLSIFWED
tara:strand:- start:60 stop:179 length:120 start_codon:yes stop_codon:yes gene_type:complete